MSTSPPGPKPSFTASRIARPARDLARSTGFYRDLLGLEVLGGFENHDGYDGVFFALPEGGQLELTPGPVEHDPGTEEDLLVLYADSPDAVIAIGHGLQTAGVRRIAAANPYWDRWGQTFLDPDGYRVVVAARPQVTGGDDLRAQRRGRKIAMSEAERDDFLAGERTCRVATVGPEGPHATPLWFVWDGAALWLYSIVRSQRWVDLQRDPRVGIVIDAGADYLELRGVEITGRAEVVGDVPRTDTPEPALAEIETRFAAKYFAGAEQMFHDGRHAWLRVVPTKITSWDFRKLTPPGA